MDPILEEELRAIIRAATRKGGTYGTQKALAQAMDVSENYISLIVSKNFTISDGVARFFGRHLVKTYPKIEEGDL